MFKTLEGRVAVITGCARSMGQAIAHGFAERGADVVGVDRLDLAETGALVEGAGRRWLGVKAELTSETDVANVARQTEEMFGRTDILVNCAGILPSMDWDDLDYATWRRVQAVNVDSQFLMCKAFVPLMRRNHYGRIINFASGIVQTPSPRFTAYRTSKAANIGFTRSLAADLGPEGITVNAVSPSFVVTPGNLEAGNEWLQPLITEAQSIKRPAKVDDIVPLVAFLASEGADFITGQTMFADGGLANR